METCPSFIPPVWLRQPPPFGKGGFGLRIHYLRSNDTGRVRERTIRRKPSCEIDSGGTPPGRDSGQFSVGKLRGSALLVGAKRMEPFIGAFGLRGPPEGTRCNLPLANCEVRRRPAGAAHSPPDCGILSFESLSGNKKSRHPMGVWIFWYAGRDSNPRPTDS